MLVTHFINFYSREIGKPIEQIADETMAALISYDWPGNVRELQNLIERAVILSCDGVLPNPLPSNRQDTVTLTEQLVQGVDVWINTPRRLWETRGTSGMKLLVNGGLNPADLDGWLAEAYTSEVGWALGDGRERGDDPARERFLCGY
jgi:transcriptional regulator with AAA-type ATPase domain